MQENESVFDSSKIEDPGFPELIPDVDVKFHVDNILSTVKIEGRKNYIISSEEYIVDIERNEYFDYVCY